MPMVTGKRMALWNHSMSDWIGLSAGRKPIWPGWGAPMIAALATPANRLAPRHATPARIEAPIANECPPMPFGLRYALASGRHARRTAQSSQMLRIARDDTLRRRKLTIEKFISRLNALG